MPERLSWTEVKRRWEKMTDEQREAVKAKQQWEHMSRLAVAHSWPSLFPAVAEHVTTEEGHEP